MEYGPKAKQANGHREKETTVTLLHHTEKEEDEKRCNPCKAICAILVIALVVLFVLSLVGYIWIFESAKPVRCFFSDTFGLDRLECKKADSLQSLNIPSASNDTALPLSSNQNGGEPLDKETAERRAGYITYGHSMWELGWEIWHDEDGWTHNSGKNDKTGQSFYKTYKELGSTYKMTGLIDISPEELFKIFVTDIDELPDWHEGIDFAEIVEEVTPDMDISYMLTEPLGGGLVSPRESVVLRYWTSRDNTEMSIATAVTNPARPPNPDKYVLSTTKLQATVFERIPENPDKTRIHMILVPNLEEGWMPSWILNRIIPAALMDYLVYLRDRAEEVKAISK